MENPTAQSSKKSCKTKAVNDNKVLESLNKVLESLKY